MAHSLNNLKKLDKIILAKLFCHYLHIMCNYKRTKIKRNQKTD